jgi:hypothetical protein
MILADIVLFFSAFLREWLTCLAGYNYSNGRISSIKDRLVTVTHIRLESFYVLRLRSMRLGFIFRTQAPRELGCSLFAESGSLRHIAAVTQSRGAHEVPLGSTKVRLWSTSLQVLRSGASHSVTCCVIRTSLCVICMSQACTATCKIHGNFQWSSFHRLICTADTPSERFALVLQVAVVSALFQPTSCRQSLHCDSHGGKFCSQFLVSYLLHF